MVVIVFVLFGLVIFVGMIVVYLWFGGFVLILFSYFVDWVNFGMYVGGVVGFLLSFFVFIVVVWIVWL